MVIRCSEASAFDLLESLDDMGARARFTRRRFGEMARQVSEGPALTWREEDGTLICVAGLWPEADHLEAWLATGPAFRRRFRTTLCEVRGALSYIAGANPVRIYVRAGERVAGARMARWLGFDATGTEALPWGLVDVFERQSGDGPT